MAVPTAVRFGIYKGGDGTDVITTMIPAHHNKLVSVANNLVALGIKYHHRLNWPLDGTASTEPGTILDYYTSINFAVGVQPVDEVVTHQNAPRYDHLYRRESLDATAPTLKIWTQHDLYCAAEVHDYMDATQRKYMIDKVGSNCRIYYGKTVNIVNGLKLAADFGSEPKHIVHVALNDSTEYQSSTTSSIAAAARAISQKLVTLGRTDMRLYMHVNTDQADTVDRQVKLLSAAMRGAFDVSTPTLECLFIRHVNPADFTSLDASANCRTALQEASGWN